ncbi:ABC transporter substrate-binding protein [Eisenbergiella tayi]|uniref:Bacterial extracellular solute-binding protein n=2 Tax=Eisenbergiella tayi TaxID=1432052 RepID=A0A1E3A9N1_9FIRM|nr:ABC transporter substrate-binding protein [Eisenbergiella tayi]ODM05121.1 Bacterial extracellular solute-binding protein [Eisenbergiella tayi]
MKKTAVSKTLALFLSAALLFAGCGKTGGEQESVGDMAGGGDKTMGRYVEEEIGRPEEMERNGGIVRLADGTLQIFDFNQGPFVSQDEGKTWTKKYDDWSGMVGEGYFMNAAAAKDGSLFLVYSTYDAVSSEEGEEASQEEVSDAERSEQPDTEPAETEDTEVQVEESDMFTIDCHYMFVSPEGETREIMLPFDMDNYELITNCWYTPDGRLLASQGGAIYEINQEDGSPTVLFETDGDADTACFSDTQMVAFTNTKAYRFDLVKGELLEQDEELDKFISGLTNNGEKGVYWTSGNYSFLVAMDKDNTLYLACQDGLYQCMAGESPKQLLQGTLCSMGDPSNGKYGMLVEDGPVFLVLFSSGLSRFTYDETMPATPDKELKVYSLKKDQTLQQAVSAYQKAHQDVFVKYEVGMSGENGLTAEDAIKALNTEIMAGNGPDVIMLDGLPIESYLAKGMLADLSENLKAAEEKEEFFDNITRVYEEDGKIYAIPTRFRIPLLMGNEEFVSNIQDLSSLSAVMEEMREKNPEGSILSAYTPEILLKMLAIASEPTWSKEDGNLQEETVKEFLTQAKKIYDNEISGISDSEKEEFLNSVRGSDDSSGTAEETALDISWSILNFLTKSQAQLAIGASQQVSLDFTNVISVPRVKPEVVYKPLSLQAENVFQAESIVGVSAKAAEPEMAREFVEMLLSYNVMSMQQEPYPVNAASFDSLFDTDMEGDGAFGSMGISKDDGSVATLDLYWPNEEEQKGLEQMVRSLKTPYLPGSPIEQAVLEAGVSVLEGNMSVDEGVAQIKQKIQLYLSE